LALYQRGENWYIDFRFKGQRIRESIGPSRKDAEKIIAKKKTEIVENKYLDIRKEPTRSSSMSSPRNIYNGLRRIKKPQPIQETFAL
jgi:hypothetical protein